MAKDTSIQINTVADRGEIVIRHGDAAKVYDPSPVRINGQITAPRRYYDSRKNAAEPNPFFPITETHVLVNRQLGTIELVRNESDVFYDSIIGRLELSSEYQTLGINSGKSYTPADLAKALKALRYLFADKSTGMELVSQLNQFKATVSADVEATKDNRGNKKNALAVAVESNVPLEFNLKIPIFKGFDPVNLRIEIALDSRGHAVDCFLESPEAMETIQDTRNIIFDEQLSDFEKDGITIIKL